MKRTLHTAHSTIATAADMYAPCRLRPILTLTRKEAPIQSTLYLFIWLVGFLTSSSTTRLYRGGVPRLTSNVLAHTRQSGETMTSVSACHIILTPTQPVRSGRPQRESNPGPRHQESCVLSFPCRKYQVLVFAPCFK